jgi:hypothetical protein
MKKLALREALVRHTRQNRFLFLPLLKFERRLRGFENDIVIDRQTDVVIEGFFRSANTFAAYAFMQAQPEKISVAYHTHAPATIIQAVKWHMPTLVLIRRPADTITSLALKHPSTSIEQGYKDYIDFYSAIAPYASHYFIATFNEVTNDFGSVMDQFNQRFCTNFVRFEHDKQNVAKVYERIERIDRLAEHGDGDLTKMSFPHSGRSEAKKQMRLRVTVKEFEPLLAEANLVYSRFVELRKEVCHEK